MQFKFVRFFQQKYSISDFIIFILSRNHMLSQINPSPPEATNFKKGMTLDEYLSEMQTLEPCPDSFQQAEEDLYTTSKRNNHSCSRKIITYEIRESEEDNYEESYDEKTLQSNDSKGSGLLLAFDKRKLNKNIQFNIPLSLKFDAKTPVNHSPGFRVRKKSNSPFSQHKKGVTGLSPNKDFAATFLNGDWKNYIGLNTRSMSPSTTLYGKFLKGMKEGDGQKVRNHSKQKYFQKKNSKDIEYVTKYEKQMYEKYSKIILPNVHQIRVQGITDRLYDRKNFVLKTHK